MARGLGSGTRRRAGVVTLALVLTLTACGGKDWPTAADRFGPASPKVLVDAVRMNSAARTARTSVLVAVGGIGAENTSISLNGTTDFATHDGSFSLTFGGAPAKLFSGSLEMRIVNGVSYIRIPKTLPGGYSNPVGGKWSETLDTSGSAAGSGPAGKAVPGLDESDSARYLSYLETVSSGVRALGSGPVRGVQATHYAATLDVAKAIQNKYLVASRRAALRQLLQVSGSPDLLIPIDVWVDGNGLLRRLQMRFTFARFPGVIGAPTLAVAIDYYDFGAPVHVQAPPADQVISSGGLSGSSS